MCLGTLVSGRVLRPSVGEHWAVVESHYFLMITHTRRKVNQFPGFLTRPMASRAMPDGPRSAMRLGPIPGPFVGADP
jgi:hypothetical protein